MSKTDGLRLYSVTWRGTQGVGVAVVNARNDLHAKEMVAHSIEKTYNVKLETHKLKAAVFECGKRPMILTTGGVEIAA